MPHPTRRSSLIQHVAALEHHRDRRAPRLARLWRYYRNPQTVFRGSGRRLPAQAEGLPDRLLTTPGDGRSRREIVIENDIAWRVHTLVEFMFGRPPVIHSTASEPGRARRIESLLRGVVQAAGGVDFFHNLALLGTIYGHVDVLLRVREPRGRRAGDATSITDALRLETIDPHRGVPIVREDDYRRLDAYLIHDRRPAEASSRRGWRGRWGRALGVDAERPAERVEAWDARVYERWTGSDDRDGFALTHRAANPLGRVPIVHVQNLPQPFHYEGLSEVEALIPLQDELNTRLSDRANRVTMQSFKMYFGKGIDGFLERSVGPGQMWTTDNPDASIETFGGDAASPSEEAHVAELREAMDKASGVSPIAAGVVGGKVGNLTSENAIRVVLMGLLARTEKKRTAYGQGVARLCELILHAADRLGLFPNDPAERGVRLDWPSPVPTDDTQTLRDAALKREIGVPVERVLAELGYGVEAPNPPTD